MFWVQIFILRQETVKPSRSRLLTWCTCKAIKPESVISSSRLAVGIPLRKVLMQDPTASILAVFHALFLKANPTSGFFVRGQSHPLLPSSNSPPLPSWLPGSTSYWSPCTLPSLTSCLLWLRHCTSAFLPSATFT